MAVSTELVRAFAAPRETMRRQLAGGENEGRALIYLMVGCLMFFVAQWPRLAREHFFDPSIPLEARISAALFGWIFIAPLFFYVVAAVSHIFARLAGGGGTWFTARMALFWSLLVISPLVLLLGLVTGFIGQGPAQLATSLLLVAAFFYIWGCGLLEAERKLPREHGTA
jgi:hypothetical protein